MDPLITLASHSPRRKELLERIDVRFQSVMVAIDETPEPHEGPEMYVLRMALEKARRGYAASDGQVPALGADTAVVLDDEILGKPRNQAHGHAMLQRLGGCTHRVVTGVALADDREVTRLSVSHVAMRPVTEDEVERYWHSGEPVDKAGGYAIQGLGGVFVEHLEGSYTGVMGLPLYETTLLFDEFSLPWREAWSR